MGRKRVWKMVISQRTYPCAVKACAFRRRGMDQTSPFQKRFLRDLRRGALSVALAAQAVAIRTFAEVSVG